MEEDLSHYNENTKLRKAQDRLLEMLLEVDRICKKHNLPYWLDGGTALGAVRHKGFIPWDDDIDIAMFREDYLKLLEVLEQELPPNYAMQNCKTEKNFYYMHTRVVDKNSLSDYGDDRFPIRKKFKHQGLFLDIFYIEKGNRPMKFIEDVLFARSFKRLKLKESDAIRTAIGYVLLPVYYCFIFFHRSLSFLFPSDSYMFGMGIPFRRDFSKKGILPVKDIEFEGHMVKGPNDAHHYLAQYYGDYMKLPPVEQRKTHSRNIEIYS